jgi:hypothetical protein
MAEGAILFSKRIRARIATLAESRGIRGLVDYGMGDWGGGASYLRKEAVGVRRNQSLEVIDRNRS